MAKRQNVVPMLMNAFALLEVFREHPEGLTYPELLLRLTKMSKVSVYRILCSLEASGYMYKDPRTSLYHLGAKFIELGRITERRQDVLVRIRPYMEALVQRFGETVNVARIENGELVYLTTMEGSHPLRVSALSSRRQALYSSAMGKAILSALPPDEATAIIDGITFEKLTPHTIGSRRAFLAELATTAKRGHALDNQENLLGVRCVSVPVLNLDSRPVAAISITGPASRLSDAKLREIAKFMTTVVRNVFGNDTPSVQKLAAACA